MEIVFAVAGEAAVGVGVVMNEWARRLLEALAPHDVAGQSSLNAAGLHDAVARQVPQGWAGLGVAGRHSCPNPR